MQIDSSLERKHKDAALLSILADGQVSISHFPEMMLNKDADSKGHIFSGMLSLGDESDCILIDDRQAQTLEEKKIALAAELRRIGRFYMKIARSVDRKSVDGS